MGPKSLAHWQGKYSTSNFKPREKENGKNETSNTAGKKTALRVKKQTYKLFYKP